MQSDRLSARDSPPGAESTLERHTGCAAFAPPLHRLPINPVSKQGAELRKGAESKKKEAYVQGLDSRAGNPWKWRRRFEAMFSWRMAHRIGRQAETDGYEDKS